MSRSYSACSATDEWRNAFLYESFAKKRDGTLGKQFDIATALLQGDSMNAPMSRRNFFRICATGLGSSSVVGLGFSPQLALAEVRTFKLSQTTETRGTCPYCSVSCGVIMYSRGQKEKNTKTSIIHVEGDPIIR